MSIKCYAKSIIGASHIRKGLVCEDCSAYGITSGEIDATVIAVADGHGSEQCVFSSEGAQAAVESFKQTIETYLDNYDTWDDILGNQMHSKRLKNNISLLWRKKVVEQHIKKNRELKTNVEISGTSTLLAFRKCIENHVGRIDFNYMPYGTTLIGAAMVEDCLLVYQIGDGQVVFIDGNGAKSIGKLDKLLGVETYSLAGENPDSHAEVSVLNLKKHRLRPYMLMLVTDGFDNSYSDHNSFLNACKDYYKMANTRGFSYLVEGIGNDNNGWLREMSDEGSGDDVSIALIFNKPEFSDVLRTFFKRK